MLKRILVVIIAIVSVALAAHAEPAPAAASADVAALKNLDGEVRAGLAALAGAYGSDVDAEAARIAAATAKLDLVKSALPDAPTAPTAARAALDENVALLAREIERARLAHACTVAVAAVVARHRTGQPATDDEVRALDDAVKGLAAGGGPGWQKTAHYFGENATRLRKDRETLAAIAKRGAELDEAMKTANRARRKVEAHLEDSPAPIPPELLDAHRAAAERVATLSPDAGRYYLMTQRELEIANAWRSPEVDLRDAALARLYQGTFVDSVVAKGGTLKVPVSTDTGWCYLVLLRFATTTGEEDVTDLKVEAKGSSPTRFAGATAGPGWQRAIGFCVDDDAKVTVSGKVSKKGKNELHAVVVGFLRTRMPAGVVTYADIVVDDPCAVDAWTTLWTNPMPGSLLYRGAEPFLVIHADRPPSDSVTLMSATGELVKDVKKSELSATAATRQFTTTYRFQGCPLDDSATDAESKKLAKCHQGLDKTYGPKIARAQTALESATSETATTKAETELQRLRDKDAAEREKKCAPIERRIEEKQRRAFDRILDFHIENPLPPTPDRAVELHAHQKANPDLR